MGHYHKPHTVPGTNITYVGSPYQVSRSEAGQVKKLLVLDRSQGWGVVEEIPLDIGPRHFIVDREEEERSDRENREEGSDREGEGELSAPPSRNLWEELGLRPGDRVRMVLRDEDVKDRKKELRKLQSRGIQVEIVAPPPTSLQEQQEQQEGGDGTSSKNRNATNTRIQFSGDETPSQIFMKYAKLKRLPHGAVNIGIHVLEDVYSERSNSSSGGLSTANNNTSQQQYRSVEFHSVELEGYFSFKDKTTYPLDNRGLTVITGNVDGPADDGMESNGAGKTALVMAALWAATGCVDARADSATTATASNARGRGRVSNADLINEDSKAARVRVKGRVNGETDFMVERVAVRRGSGGGLKLWIDGEDCTAAEVRLTQAAIDSLLGTHLLGRTVFYGQNDVSALLEASDRALKDELGKLVELEVWTAARERSWAAMTALRGDINRCEDEMRVRLQMIGRLKGELGDREQRQQEAERNYKMAQEQLQREAVALHQAASRAAHILNNENDSSSSSSNGSIMITRNELEERLYHLQKQQGAAESKIWTNRKTLGNLNSLSSDAICDRCFQPIDEAHHQHLMVTLNKEILEAEEEVQVVLQQASSIKERLMLKNLEDRARNVLLLLLQQGVLLNEDRDTTTADIRIAALSSALSAGITQTERAADRVKQLSYALSSLLSSSSDISDVDRLQSLIKLEQDAITTLEQTISDITVKGGHYRMVDDAFRPTGIVNFVLEGVLGDLQRATARHLAALTTSVTLELAPYRSKKTSTTTSSSKSRGIDSTIASTTADNIIEQIEKVIKVRVPGALEYRRRSVSQLSGGERRRVALALALGFSELTARRGRLRSNLLVMDEVMQHLDGQGRWMVARLLRGMLEDYGTILIVAQRDEWVGLVDRVDVVVKDEEGGSRLMVNEDGDGGGGGRRERVDDCGNVIKASADNCRPLILG
jgi:ABC-type dipeptide/oligopeptide/nickel transport system ATPase component